MLGDLFDDMEPWFVMEPDGLIVADADLEILGVLEIVVDCVVDCVSVVKAVELIEISDDVVRDTSDEPVLEFEEEPDSEENSVADKVTE